MVTIDNVPWAFGGAGSPTEVYSFDAETNTWVEQASIGITATGHHSAVAWNVPYKF